MELIASRAAGTDIGKATLKATVRIQGGSKRATRREVRTFGTTTGQLLALRDWLVAEQVSLVGMESTGCFGNRSTTSLKMPCSAGCSTPSI
jgi:transposase